jgi:hypothetical protein
VGHLEERMIAIARLDAPDESLEGVYRPGAPGSLRGVVIAAPHPLYGGSIESPVVNELSWACARIGLPSIAFNWRGVGASSGVPSGDVADADADYASALAHMAETVQGPLVAAGYSFGAAAAVRAAAREKRVDRVVLVAPPPRLLAPEAIAALDRPALVIVGAHDELAPLSELASELTDVPQVRLEAIPRADHFFLSGLAVVGRATAEWLQGG